jgi:hypothetical protein
MPLQQRPAVTNRPNGNVVTQTSAGPHQQQHKQLQGRTRAVQGGGSGQHSYARPTSASRARAHAQIKPEDTVAGGATLQHSTEDDDDPRSAAAKWQRGLRSDMRDGSPYSERRSPSTSPARVSTAALARSGSVSPPCSRSPGVKGPSSPQQPMRSSMSSLRPAAQTAPLAGQAERHAPTGAGGSTQHVSAAPGDAQHGVGQSSAGVPGGSLDAMVAAKVQFIKAEVSTVKYSANLVLPGGCWSG